MWFLGLLIRELACVAINASECQDVPVEKKEKCWCSPQLLCLLA